MRKVKMSVSFFLQPPDCLLKEFKSRVSVVAGMESPRGEDKVNQVPSQRLTWETAPADYVTC